MATMLSGAVVRRMSRVVGYLKPAATSRTLMGVCMTGQRPLHSYPDALTHDNFMQAMEHLEPEVASAMQQAREHRKPLMVVLFDSHKEMHSATSSITFCHIAQKHGITSLLVERNEEELDIHRKQIETSDTGDIPSSMDKLYFDNQDVSSSVRFLPFVMLRAKQLGFGFRAIDTGYYGVRNDKVWGLPMDAVLSLAEKRDKAMVENIANLAEESKEDRMFIVGGAHAPIIDKIKGSYFVLPFSISKFGAHYNFRSVREGEHPGFLRRIDFMNNDDIVRQTSHLFPGFFDGKAPEIYSEMALKADEAAATYFGQTTATMAFPEKIEQKKTV